MHSCTCRLNMGRNKNLWVLWSNGQVIQSFRLGVSLEIWEICLVFLKKKKKPNKA